MELKILQINLHHSKAATANLVYLMESRQYDVALIQEPWVARGNIKGLHSKELLLYKSNLDSLNSNPRTCIVARKQFNLFLLTTYSNIDQTTVKLERDGLPTLIFSSTYMPYDSIEGPPADITKTLISFASKNKFDIILGCDSNSHHVQWGSTDINTRGESLFEYIIENNLVVANIGNTPTFVTKTREEVLDITLTNNSDTCLLEKWKVLDEISFSDHKLIEFYIPDAARHNKPFRNNRRTDWHVFNREIVKKLSPLRTDNNLDPNGLDKLTEEFTEILRGALDKSCPLITATKKNNKPPWWTVELSNIRKETRKLFNRAKRTRAESDWESYKTSQRKFKTETQRAKRCSWRNFCSTIECTNHSARLRKILSKTTTPIGSLKGPDNQWTESCQDSLKLLVQAHFPGCNSELENESINSLHSLCEIPREIITKEKLIWAINSFSPYKSPGLDGVFPLMLQKSSEFIIPYLITIFQNSLQLGYVPKTWREVKVVFIPKAGKSSYTEPKDFRPISLTSFTLKTLERLIDIHIRSYLRPETISPFQHAYTKGRSVETALHCAVRTIEKSLAVKEYTLAAFLDIEGAFNNVHNSAIEKALTDLKIEDTVIKWIVCMLKNRQINSELGGSHIKMYASRGTPQGGILSPLLWILVMNEILIKLNNSGVKVIAYADDLALLATGKYLTTVSEQLESALSKVSNWTRRCGLKVNPLKTELVLFTNRRKIPPFVVPKIEGTPLKIADKAKYLGVILDKKLNWGPNIQERYKKATFALYSCNRILGRNWGPSPKIIMWMYTAIVRPILTYGSLVWWQALEKSTNLKTLTKVQRTACISTTGVMRSTPTAGLEAILNLTPLDLFVKELAANSALRLSQTNIWNTSQNGHTTILSNYVGNNVSTDYMTPYLDFNKSFNVSFPNRQDWENSVPFSNESTIAIFTDGSKMNTGVGAGFYSENLNLASSFRLPDHSSVFQAEILAVKNAAKQISMMAISPADITFFIDSQAAIKAISATLIKSKLVSCCREELRVLGTQHNVRLCWVPGHSDVFGNEKADELAREGSVLDPSLIDHSIRIPQCEIKRNIVNNISQKTNERWNLLETCGHTRKLWPNFDEKKSNKILLLSKPSLRSLIGVLTGHNLLGYHKKKMGLSTDDLCRGCGNEDEQENTVHFLCHCPALCRTRKKFLGNYFFNELEELSELSGNSLLNFVKSSKWLEQP